MSSIHLPRMNKPPLCKEFGCLLSSADQIDRFMTSRTLLAAGLLFRLGPYLSPKLILVFTPNRTLEID